MPLIALVLGLASGGTAALVLAPSGDTTEHPADGEATPAVASEADAENTEEPTPGNLEIVKLPSQFVIPVILDNRVRAMVILTVALEVETGAGDAVRAMEPKLRDEYLTELFGLAALGGFKDELISRQTIELVKRALTERSRQVLGTRNVNVLITDMARQDTF